MLVMQKKNKKNIPGTQDAVASRVPFAPEVVVVAFGRVVVVVVVLLEASSSLWWLLS